jgi:signal transduction histidine kinase
MAMDLNLTFPSEQLYRQIVQTREDENKQLARELHDQIIQSLVVLNYQLATLRDGPPTNQSEQVLQLQQQVHRLISDVRNICANLRPSVLDSLGLSAAIRSHIRGLQPTTASAISFQAEGSDARLPERIELCLYRVAQEALANALKHAQARQIQLTLTSCSDAATLVVQDDGCGFTMVSDLNLLLVNRHFGLVGMRERLELLDGSLSICAAPGSGTWLRASVPLGEPAKPVCMSIRPAEVSR